MASGVFGVAYFIYQTIYTTITNTNAIVVLSSNLNVQGVNIETYTKTQALIAEKNTLVSTTLRSRNIFRYDNPLPSALTTTSTKTP